MLELAADNREIALGYGARSSSISMLDVEPAERGQHDTNNEEYYRDGRSGEVWRRGVLEDQPPPKTPVRRV
jgi:hypothetical protein